jgi:ribosome-binding factor A
VDHQRSDRVGDLLLELISELLRKELRDPRLGAVALTGAKVTKDLRHARIYFNLLGDLGNQSDALAGLKSATGFIRSKVGKELKLRFIPTLEFFYDETEDQAQRIDELLKQIKP